MSTFRRLFILAASAVVIILAASLAFSQFSPSRAASATVPALAQAETDTPAPTPQPTKTTAPTKTVFVFPTLPDSPAPTSTALPPSATLLPPTSTALPPSATALPPTSAAATLPTLEPAAADTLTPLSVISSNPTTVTYTVTISDVYSRLEPILESNLSLPLKRGQSYTVTGQSPDGIWLHLELPQAIQGGWVPAAFGLTYGSLEIVPLAGPTLTAISQPVSPTAAAPQASVSDSYLPVISARTRSIYRYGLLLGNSPHAFIKIGDCQTIYPFFLSAFDSPKNYRLGDSYAYLQETIRQFAGSFAHNSAAAQTGFGTATVLDPQWANPKVCRPGESPLVCEYRAMQPSLAIISLGTNDIWQADGRHEKNMRQIIDYLIRRGVVPILSTKADNVEGDGSFNRLMVQLAAEYQLPLWDFWQVTRNLPQNGLIDLYHLSWGPAMFDDPKNLLLGWPSRNLTALQALDAVWRAVR
jgi:hypothetical protein